MRVYIGAGRFIVNATLVSESAHTAQVALPDGSIVKRHKLKDFVNFAEDKLKEIENKKGRVGESVYPEVKVKTSFWNRFVKGLKIFFNGGQPCP